MAGDWIKFELTTLDKPEVCQIADLADIDPDAVVGKLMRVWGWFDQQTENGNAPSVSKKLLDRLVGVSGFCEYMKSVCWMVEEGGVISLPHFDRHNGKTAKNRLLTAKRVAKHKVGNAKTNDSSVTNALPKEDVEKIKEQQQGADARQRFEMHEHWQPDEVSLAAQTKLQGVPISLITSDVVAEFVSFWMTKAVADSHGGWCHRLAKHAKAQGVRDEAKPQAPPAAQSSNWAENGVRL